jgi:exo-beta-1,3-glucanase (GH17 family)
MPGYGYGYDQSMPGGRQPYQGDGYDEFMDPRDIADDGDDFEEPQRQRRSRLGGALAGGAGAGTAMKAFGPRDASGNYGAVPGGLNGSGQEKSEWLKRQTGSNKKLKWIVGIVIVLIVIGAAVGIVVGVLLKNNGSSGPQRGSASDNNGIWDINSSQVQAVLNNKNLHKVFPGMDYTPLNAQYPDCLSNPPFQNDVTLDVAVMAQMTPAIRLYGTDCNQTQLVLEGINLLGYNDTVKVWLGVWLSNNQTTNTRQLNQMYDILDKYPEDHFAGVIVGNEVLFREDMTITQLANQISKVKSNLSKKGITLPVSTSDLGDDWTQALASDSDIVMSNVHPFFAGVTPDQAPGWTWSFWQTHDVILKAENGAKYPTNIISETGWPSQGGNDCGTGAKCATKTEGAIAGIDELNEFMDGWVCQSMANGTTYFWFEAFDVSDTSHPH